MTPGTSSKPQTLQWAREELVWRLLRVFSAATTAAAVSFGLFFVFVGGSALGWVIIALGLPLLAPRALRRHGFSARVAANVLLVAGTVMMVTIAWVSGGARTTSFPAYLLLPVVAVLLTPRRDARAWLLVFALGLVGVWVGDLEGLTPPSLVPSAYVRETRLLTLLTGVGVAFLFSLIFRASYRRARDELRASRLAMADLLRGLGAAGDDLRRAAGALQGPSSTTQDRDGEPALPATPGLVVHMRREAKRAQEFTDRAWRTVEGFGRAYESIGGEILALAPRLTEVEKLAAGVQDLGARLDILALHVGVQASLVGEVARPFKRLSETARTLAKRVEADAQGIAATMERIQRAADTAAALAREGTGLRREATPRLEALSRSFGRVVKLAERASDVGEAVVEASLQHLGVTEMGLREVVGSHGDGSKDLVSHAATASSSGPGVESEPSSGGGHVPPTDRWARLPRLFAGVGVAALATAVLFAVVDETVSAALFGGIGFVSLTAALVPAPATAQPWLAGLFLAITTVLVGFGSWLSGGLASPAFPGLVLLPVLAVFLFGRKVGLLGALVALAVGTSFLLAERAGELPAVPFEVETWKALNMAFAVLFLTRLYQYSTWSRDQIRARNEHLERAGARAEEAARELRDAGATLARATEELRAGSLVQVMHQEAGAGDEHARETLASFGGVVSRYEAIEDAINRANGEAAGLDEALHRIDGMAHDVDLLALQIALEAVRMGEQGAAFRLLADEMMRLSAVARADANDMMARLAGTRDAVRKTQALTAEGGEAAREASEAVRALATAFQEVCRLVERAADASQDLADLADDQLYQLRQGLAGRTSGAAGVRAVIASPEAG